MNLLCIQCNTFKLLLKIHIYRQRSIKNIYKKLQVKTTIHFYKVPHDKTGNLNRAKVLSFSKGKLTKDQLESMLRPIPVFNRKITVFNC